MTNLFVWHRVAYTQQKDVQACGIIQHNGAGNYLSRNRQFHRQFWLKLKKSLSEFPSD